MKNFKKQSATSRFFPSSIIRNCCCFKRSFVWCSSASRQFRVLAVINDFSFWLYFLCHGDESLFHIQRFLGRSLKELETEVTCIFFSLLCWHLSFWFQVFFIPNHKLDYIVIGMTINFLQPSLKILEGLFISYVINKDNSVRSFVIRWSDCFKSLLACCVPDL